ncbi:Hypp5227 [Branchiostoma lanceolatum]|uniref:Hypp5227 protein n=1 Tax=Branchiostoma lanceolatum TaxID=7740 RepID=A0A8K0F0V0_BRALA|nr:Hypp5227 [Branchiostoma lanceolatum]
MGKGERRGRVGRRRAAAGHQRRRQANNRRNRQRRHHHRSGGGATLTSLFSAGQSAGGQPAQQPHVLSRRLVVFGLFCLIPGIVTTALYSGSTRTLALAGYGMLGVGILMILVAWGLRCKAGNAAQNNATPQVQQMEEGVQQADGTAMHTLTVVGLQQSLSNPCQQPPPYPGFRYRPGPSYMLP